MLNTKLIFVEGIAGAGKSTTAQYLALALEHRGLDACWLHEDESRNVLRAYYRRNQFPSPQAYMREAQSNWARFAEHVKTSKEILILDGTLFQVPIVGLLLDDVKRQAIQEFVNRIVDIISVSRPVLIHLRPPDIRETITHACRSRYAALLDQYVRRNEDSPYGRRSKLSGVDGLVAFWKEVMAISDQARERADFPKMAIGRASDDWEAKYRRIIRFLGVPSETVVDAFQPASLSRYVGTYTRGEGKGKVEFPVTLDDGALIVRGLSPYLWDAGNRLIPVAENVFLAASWHTKVVFGAGEDGVITGLRLETSDEGWRRTDEFFPKVR